MKQNISSKDDKSTIAIFSQMLEDHARLTKALIKAQEKEYILLILEAEFRTQRLIYGLEQIGMKMNHFYPNLRSVILTMIGFSFDQVHDESIVNFYRQQVLKWMETPLPEFFDNVPEMANMAFRNLQKRLENNDII